MFPLISPPWKRLHFYDSGEVVGEIEVYPQLPYHWKACSFTGGPQTQQLKLCYPTFYSQRHTSWIRYPVVHQDEIRMPSWGGELHWCWFSFSVQVWMTHEYLYPYALTLGSHCSRHKWSWYFCTLAISQYLTNMCRSVAMLLLSIVIICSYRKVLFENPCLGWHS